MYFYSSGGLKGGTSTFTGVIFDLGYLYFILFILLYLYCILSTTESVVQLVKTVTCDEFSAHAAHIYMLNCSFSKGCFRHANLCSVDVLMTDILSFEPC